ncbi:hypothetical protein [Ruegeria sp. HKCCD7255]|uniref:hypothetical protein n=1 Tax=Ruegeria sp. HKCCD7255 TaxID=2683004 RepID=UPI0014896AE1|nr:hypothetical protein [Ruegeria sp. HKCCD7255]
MRFLAAFLMLFPFTSAHAQDFSVGTLNTESASDTQPFMVSRTIRGVGKVDVWALQEVAGLSAVEEYTVAAGAVGRRSSYRAIVSESGTISQQHRRDDQLAIVYNSSRFRQVENVELHGIRSKPGAIGGRLGEPDWNLRGALFIRLQDKDTGVEFYVGNVHLKCCGDSKNTRAHQAEIIKAWIERSDVQVILTGDFNIPVQPSSADGNQNSDAFKTLESVMTWERPQNPIKTQCSEDFDSMLDHFFIKEGPNIGTIDVAIHETESAFCDAEKVGGPDHRPVVAQFSIQP